MHLTQPTIAISKSEIETTKFVRLYKFDECLEYLEKKNTNDSIGNHINPKLSKEFELLRQAGHFLQNLKCYDDATEYYQKALEIKERATTNADTDTSLVITLHSIGRCCLDMNEHNKALNYFERALEIKERATTNADTDTSLAIILHSIGRCCLDMNQHN